MSSSIRVDASAASAFSDAEIHELAHLWPLWARPEQLPPKGSWTTWLLMGGRGSGKTRAGAEWVRSIAARGVSPIALVGQTMREAIDVMVRGPSGLMRVTPLAERPRLRGNQLLWANGAEAIVLPATDAERFRGPQFAAAWCDEIGKWPNAETSWDMLQFGLRLGARPRQLATTTPRPTALIKRLIADRYTIATRMTTAENKAHLADSFLQAVVGRYRNTVLGRQELDGELIEDMPGALWSREMIRIEEDDTPLERIVVAVDPPTTSNLDSDACGIVVAGRRGDRAVVISDHTVHPAPPLVWARRAVAAYEISQADCIAVEVNQGGEMVKTIIAQVDSRVPVRPVHASRGKWLRAEPVAALYAQGRVTHRPGLTALEDEMCSFGGALLPGKSPDRMDALVWALTELMLRDGPRPVMRRL